MEMTRAADYGLRAMMYLAGRTGSGSVLIGEIASSMQIPPQFLHKVMPRLVKAGLLHSRRGARGGYRLSRLPSEISALDVIESIDGPILVNRCLVGSSDCGRLGACAIQTLCREAQDAIRKQFASRSLDQLYRLDLEVAAHRDDARPDLAAART